MLWCANRLPPCCSPNNQCSETRPSLHCFFQQSFLLSYVLPHIWHLSYVSASLPSLKAFPSISLLPGVFLICVWIFLLIPVLSFSSLISLYGLGIFCLRAETLEESGLASPLSVITVIQKCASNVKWCPLACTSLYCFCITPAAVNKQSVREVKWRTICWSSV